MKVYHVETGKEYKGEPVDCAELVATGSWSRQQVEGVRPEDQAIAAPASKASEKPSRKKAE